MNPVWILPVMLLLLFAIIFFARRQAKSLGLANKKK